MIHTAEKGQKIEKMFFKIIAFESGVANSDNPEQYTYLSSVVNVLTNFPNISHINKGDIFQISSPQSDEKNMMKVLSSRFREYLGPFNMLTVKECSKMAQRRDWSNQVFQGL